MSKKAIREKCQKNASLYRVDLYKAVSGQSVDKRTIKPIEQDLLVANDIKMTSKKNRGMQVLAGFGYTGKAPEPGEITYSTVLFLFYRYCDTTHRINTMDYFTISIRNISMTCSLDASRGLPG